MSVSSSPFQRAIRRLRKSGYTKKSIAEKLDVSANTVTDLANGQVNPRWRLGANLIALSDGHYPAALPHGISDFQALVGQLRNAGWTQHAIARAISGTRQRTRISCR